jgi:Integrase core domain
MTNPSSAVFLTRSALVPHCLYVLNCISPSTIHKPKATLPLSLPVASVNYAAHVPDIKTWYCCPRHCNNRAIIDMACHGIVKGMHIDLLSSPTTCDHCILGKQTHLPVLKLHEGLRAECQLEQVYVDLCGPLPCVSQSRHLFSMNVIDDFSSYVWSIPVQAKSNAAIALRNWHHAVERQTGEKLRVLVTDNSELVSKSITDWCSLHGIDH